MQVITGHHIPLKLKLSIWFRRNSVTAGPKPKCLVIDEIDGALGDGEGAVEIILQLVQAVTITQPITTSSLFLLTTHGVSMKLLLVYASVEDTSGSSEVSHLQPFILMVSFLELLSGALVKIWDVKSQESYAQFDVHIGEVTAISFSESGYILPVGFRFIATRSNLKMMIIYLPTSVFCQHFPSRDIIL